jgi:hypothetical protein
MGEINRPAKGVFPVDTYIKDPVTGDYTLVCPTYTAPVVIQSDDYDIDAGRHFFSKQVVPFDGVANEVGYFMFRTPDTPTRIYANASFYGNVEFLIEIYEGSTVTDDGTAVSAFNNDRDSGLPATLEAFANPIPDVLGDLMWIAQFGSGKDATGVSSGFGYKIKVKRNTMYVFKITKIAVQTGYLDAGFWWKEVEPDN